MVSMLKKMPVRVHTTQRRPDGYTDFGAISRVSSSGLDNGLHSLIGPRRTGFATVALFITCGRSRNVLR